MGWDGMGWDGMGWDGRVIFIIVVYKYGTVLIMEEDGSAPNVITRQEAEAAYQSCTIAILKQICKENGIVVPNITKPKLIQLMIENMTHREIPFRLPEVLQSNYVQSIGTKRKPSQGAVRRGRPGSSDDEEKDKDKVEDTPTTATSIKRVAEFEKKGFGWFATSFLEEALTKRLDQSKDVGQANPSPTLFILVGPASVGKSSAKRLIPAMTYYVVNVDVDEIKLYGNDVLPQHPHPKKSGEMLSDVEGIQFKYDLVLEKLRSMVFQNATMFGKGQYKNIILDTTGSMSDQLKMYIRTAKQTYNYTVKVIIVYSDKMQCLQRVKERNRVLFQNGQGTRYIPPRVVSSIYDTFLEKNQVNLYAISPRMSEPTDELILVDNRTEPRIVAIRQPSGELKMFPDDEHTLVGVDGAFYGLTLNPEQAGQPASIIQGNIGSAIEKAEREWKIFDEAEKRAKAEREASSMGGSRKRRISKRRRIRGTRIRKTVKKYSRPHTRRRHHRRHSHRR
jgi:hypothetical protein